MKIHKFFQDFEEEEEADSDDSYDDRYRRPQGKKRTPLKNRKGGRPSYSQPKAKPKPKEVFPPVSEMVIESIKALKDNPK